jgi:hypothetical protein
MSSRKELMTECAKTSLRYGDKEAHDAILAAIEDPIQAGADFPDSVSDIVAAVEYANRELKNSGYSG